MTPVRRPRLSSLLVAAGLCAAAASAQAVELYGQFGLPGVGLGLAHPISPLFGVRADYVTLGNRDKTQTENGILYQGKFKSGRLGLYGDLFPFSGRFRVTAGMTSNDYKLTLDASGANAPVTIGGNTYGGPGDGLNVQITYPKTTPYIGIGWGHQQETGLRFSTDIGASIGRAKVTSVARGNVSQADADAETAKLRDGVGKIRVLPQISMSVGYSF